MKVLSALLLVGIAIAGSGCIVAHGHHGGHYPRGYYYGHEHHPHHYYDHGGRHGHHGHHGGGLHAHRR